MDTYYEIPVTLDQSEKNVSVRLNPEVPVSAKIEYEIQQLNKLYTAFRGPENPASGVPVRATPARSASIKKLREEANKLFNDGEYEKAANMYKLAIRMASIRPPWEEAATVRTELEALYANRSQAYIQLRRWPEALADARTSVEMGRDNNVRAWWRVGRCLAELGRLAEARDWTVRAVAMYPNEKDVKELHGLVVDALEKGTKFVLPSI